MRKRTLAIIVTIQLAVFGLVGCATFQGNTPGENVNRVLQGMQYALDGVTMIMQNFNIGTPKEMEEVRAIIVECRTDITNLTDKIVAIIERDESTTAAQKSEAAKLTTKAAALRAVASTPVN